MKQDNTSYIKSYEQILTNSILEDRPQRAKLTLDDIPTRGTLDWYNFTESGYREPRRRDIGLRECGLRSQSRVQRLDSDRDSPKVLNFKEFYDISRIGVDFEEKEIGKRSKSNFEREVFMFQGGVSKIGERTRPMKQASIINYNINEYLPSSSKYNSKSNLSINASLLASQYQHNQSTNIFKDNMRQQEQQNIFGKNFSLSPKFQSQQTQLLQCVCGGDGAGAQRNSQLIMTQRSSCSCQYSQSQSSAGPSNFASPLSNCSKQHQQQLNQQFQNVNGFHRHQSSQSFLNQQHTQINNMRGFNQQVNAVPMIQLQRPVSILTSGETTPKPASSNQQNTLIHVNKSPINNARGSQNNLFEDRSISFLRSTDEKLKTGGGYNTDDLVRDSESEVDLTQVSHILQGVQLNFQEGFQKYLKITQSQNQKQIQKQTASQFLGSAEPAQYDQEQRQKKEQLAMMILQGMNPNQVRQDQDQFNIYLMKQEEEQSELINESQLKTVKQTNGKEGSQMALDALQISQINQNSTVQTPLSNFETNFSQAMQQDMNNQLTQKQSQASRNISSQQQQLLQQQQLQNLALLQQQYQSPCFNSFEDSSLNLFQQQLQQQQIPGVSGGKQLVSFQQTNSANPLSEQSSKQDYQSVQSLNQGVVFQQQQQPSQHEQNQRPKQNQKQPKSKQSKQLLKKIKKTYANEESETPERSPYSGRSSKEVSPCQSQIQQHQSNHKQDQSNSAIIKVLREISIQAQTDVSATNITQTEKQKSDASCQYEPPSNSNEKKRSQLPPSQKRVQSLTRINQPNVVPLKSLGGSIVTSKNSTITPLNSHFRSQNPSNDLEDYYLHMEEESQAHSYKTNALQLNAQVPSNLGSIPHQNVLSPYNLPQGVHFDHFKSHCSEVIIRGSSETDISNRIQRFKSMRGGENQSQGNFQSQSNANIHTNRNHQISEGQSLNQLDQNSSSFHNNHLNSNSRSQFTSIDTHSNSPIKIQSNQFSQKQGHSRQILDRVLDQGKRKDSNINAGDTFMKQQLMMNQVSQILATEEAEDGFQSDCNIIQNYQDFNGEKTNQHKLQQLQQNFQNFEYQPDEYSQSNPYLQVASEVNADHLPVGNQSQTEEEFNYTVRLHDTSQNTVSPLKINQSKVMKTKPPMHNLQRQGNQNAGTMQQQYGNQFGSYQALNNTGSTAGFPQLHGYQFSQQTGRENPSPASIHSSFHSQNNVIAHSNSQTSFQYVNNTETTYDRRVPQTRRQLSFLSKNHLTKKLSFMEKVVMIQRSVRRYILTKRSQNYSDNSYHIEGLQTQEDIPNKKTDVQDYQNQLNSGDSSTMQRPGEESLSNISAQMLNSLKQSLGINMKATKDMKPSEQSYQKNILESLNLTTGNTFIKETRQFNQGLLPKDRTQALGNSSALVLFSGSTYDNRGANPFQGAHVRNSDFLMNGALNHVMESQQSYQRLHQEQDMQKDSQSPNNTSLLNLTEESNSGFFKLTPMGSQNITQKTHHLNFHNQTGPQANERTTESNNLNYSCSEIDSEWCQNIQKECSISPMSVNTTSSKIRNLNGTKAGQRTGPNHPMFQRSGSIQSEQIQQISSYQNPKYSQQMRIEENVQSPLSVSQIPVTTKSAATNHLYKQEQMLSILKSNEYDLAANDTRTGLNSSVNKGISEWKLLTPIKQDDLNNILLTLLTQRQTVN